MESISKLILKINDERKWEGFFIDTNTNEIHYRIKYVPMNQFAKSYSKGIYLKWFVGRHVQAYYLYEYKKKEKENHAPYEVGDLCYYSTYKQWDEKGELIKHEVWENDCKIKDYLE